MEQYLIERNIATEFNLKSVTKNQCRTHLLQFFGTICKESPEIKSDWEEVDDYIQSEINPIPIKIYEKEVVPNAVILFDRFSIWNVNTRTDNQFLIQAMVNKIALPLWMILAICHGNIQQSNWIYCRYRYVVINATCFSTGWINFLH